MTTYKITEKQNENSTREGYLVKAKSLKSAKIIASKRQAFFGTVLTIESENGSLLTTKVSGIWK